ncbi:MAG: peptidase S1 [Rhodobacterales bacterium CG15_BIG_FIL_POST_REV_8_21_14_020_59_13]|nr:MAG: peptidase S1 [Rhodobacterales bacterium CG15_BIG_FIL_POST_REV_8_21_14_020_59_13]
MLRTLTLSAAASALAVFAMAGAAEAQDWRLNPSYGSVSLVSGFSPDPYLVSLQSGGSIDASRSIGGSCRGFVANAPDYRLNYQAGNVLPLIISVSSNSDTTLVINAPDQRWYCDDDGGQGLNPSLRWNSPMTGQYDIYVGTYGNASYQNATLSISELRSY